MDNICIEIGARQIHISYRSITFTYIILNVENYENLAYDSYEFFTCIFSFLYRRWATTLRTNA